MREVFFHTARFVLHDNWQILQHFSQKESECMNSSGEVRARQQQNRELLSTEQVARWFGISARTITAMAVEWHETGGKKGLPGFKIGRNWRFDSRQLEAWLKAQQETTLGLFSAVAKSAADADLPKPRETR